MVKCCTSGYSKAIHILLWRANYIAPTATLMTIIVSESENLSGAIFFIGNPEEVSDLHLDRLLHVVRAN